MVDYINDSYLHLKNVLETQLAITVAEGSSDLTVVPTGTVYYIDNLVGYPQIDPESGFYIAGHKISVRTANTDYQEAHKIITDATYNIVSAVYRAQQTLLPKLAGKSPTWTKVEHAVNTYSNTSGAKGKAEAHIHTGEVEFYLRLTAFSNIWSG